MTLGSEHGKMSQIQTYSKYIISLQMLKAFLEHAHMI